MADTEGYVRRPDIDLGSQMAQMIMAQRAYQANLASSTGARLLHRRHQPREGLTR
jgi:flagellar basal-body rod protein FlgC